MYNEANVNISDYAAKTQFNFHSIDIPIVEKNNLIPIGLDIGYSATKVYSIYGKHIFPSFLMRFPNEYIINIKDTDILYRNEQGEIWGIGNVARERVLQDGIPIQSKKLYGRQRIDSPEFLVLIRVGLFLGLAKKDLDHTFLMEKERKIKIRTGLPVDYFMTDSENLESKFIGHHRYEVKIGTRDWVKVDLDITEDDITVITQPFGTLWSLIADFQGKLINEKLLGRNVLIYDGGQHTTDTHFNQKGAIGESTTWTDISMVSIINKVKKAVFENTGGKGDFKEYAFDGLITDEIEPCTVRYNNRGSIQLYDFTRDVLKATEEVAKYAISELNIVYNYLADFHALICTGGVGKLFYPYFKNEYSHLDVILAEKSDATNPAENFDTVLANVVGYFKSLLFEMAVEEEIQKDIEVKKNSSKAENIDVEKGLIKNLEANTNSKEQS